MVKTFKNLADEEIMPHLKTIIPWKYYHVIKNCKSFKQFLNQSCTQVKCEDIYTSKLKEKMKNVPHSRNAKGDRIVINTYIRIL